MIYGSLMNEYLVVPKGLQADIIALTHEGHQCADKSLHLIRESCWFPKIHKMVSEYVNTCKGCNAALPYVKLVPLKPNLLPNGPWEKLHADFKGPIGSKYYPHVLIDQFCKYPEVDIVSTTKFTKLRSVLDQVFATHGIQEEMSSDNGPLYGSHEMKIYANEMGFKLKPTAPEDPQANGFA